MNMQTPPQTAGSILVPAPPPPLVVPNVSTDIARYIDRYIKIRDKKKEMQDRHKAELAPINTALDALEQGFLNHLNGTNSDNAVAKGIGTAYRTVRHSATIEDGATFRRHVIGAEAWHLADWKANANAVHEAMVETKAPVPGVKFSSEAVVNIRRS
jgi:hypothetical protein